MGKWEMVRLGDVLEYEQPTKYIVESTDYDNAFDTPVLTAGQSFILGYTNETRNIYTNLPVIIFDDFTTATKYVDFPFKVKSSAMKILRATEKADIKFLSYYISTISVDTGLHRRYWISKYVGMHIPLPPLKVQQQITDVLDRASALIEKRKIQIDKLDVLVKSQFVELFGDPVVNSKGWKIVKLKEITSKIGSGATPRGGKESYTNEGVSLIRSMNVHNSYFKYDDLAFLGSKQARLLENVAVNENDVLLNITGASVARACIVPSEVLPARVNQHVAIIRAENICPIFLACLLTNASYQQLLVSLASRNGATREAITKRQLEALEIPLPPDHLQEQFSDFVKQVDVLKCMLKKSLIKFEINFKSLIQKCFRAEVF